MKKPFENASWITSQKTPIGSAVLFYKNFSFSKKIKSAKLLVSAVGVYELYINSQKIDDCEFKPGITSYKNRLQYQSFDVLSELKENTEIAIEVAPGWAVGKAMYPMDKIKNYNLFSDHTAVIAELFGEYEDGTCFYFSTDESWDVRSSRIIFSDLYDGETVDYTIPIAQYGKAIKFDKKINLVKQLGDGVIENERLSPVATIITPKGETVLDFGQNMTGVVEFILAGKYGERLSYTCAEVLDKDGNFYNENYRDAKSKVTFVLDGKLRTLRSKFSFQGFRYIRLDEYPEDFFTKAQSITAIVLHTKLKRTGQFVCGNQKINQLFHNIIWGQKGNYLDIPTDCPQRNERLGWTGDAQIFCRTAAYNYDVRSFFHKWLADVRLEQTNRGAIYGICPQLVDSNIYHTRISAGWGDCITIIPWELYQVYGDKNFLSDNFNAMKRWVEYIRSTGDDEYLWLTGHHYGDWLAMDEGMEDSYVGATANDLVASAFYAYSVDLLIKAGHVLDKDMTEYELLLENIKKEFYAYFLPNGEFLDTYPHTEIISKHEGPSDIVRKGLTQTALTLILKFGICKDSDKKRFAKKLDELIEKNGGKMATGFLGTPYLLQTLTENGYIKRAYDLFFNEDNPSWLYSVNHDATTMWEHWNSLKEDGSFWSPDMNSFNHYAYGAVGAWMYETIAGIKIKEDSIGFEKVILSPTPDKRLGFVKCSIDTIRGTIESAWEYKDDHLNFSFVVPKDVQAEIRLPNGFTTSVKDGKYEYSINL